MSLFDSTIQQMMPQLLLSPALDVALRQRAKFENWLKIEVENMHRPITKNIKGIMEDVHKLLVTLPLTSGYILFPVFPVATRESDRAKQLAAYLNRIRACGVEFVAEGFVSRHPDWGISWHSGRVIAHG